MAQHVLSPATVERRLRPIYDNLEVGNNRKALQECEKVLKKHPHLLCARALKGLALLRLGRVEESDIFLTAVANERPSDDSTLQVLSFCYKELEQRVLAHNCRLHINFCQFIILVYFKYLKKQLILAKSSLYEVSAESMNMANEYFKIFFT